MPAFKQNIFLPLLTLLLTIMLSSSLAYALTLEEAKSSGQVGEQTNGYLGSVNPAPSTEVIALVNDINQKRKKAYQEIAQKNNTPISEVEKLAAEKAINKTSPGNYVQINGQWVKK